MIEGLRLCSCGLAMYALEDDDGEWTFICTACDPNLEELVPPGIDLGGEPI